MALTAKEVISMLDDTYEDNSDDDLEFDIVEQENTIFSEGKINNGINKRNHYYIIS